jgi:glycosyltransferase involved in cell wall biosynthesis
MFGTHANAAGMILKRAALFLHAIPAVLERFPDQKFMIIGERGDAYAWARELADTLGIGHALEFVGRVSNHAIPEYLNRSRLYVQISDSESFGVAIVEAMACQTPVVVSRKGAIPEVVGDVGVYVDNNDPAAVAAGIIQALSQTEAESQRTGSRARQRVIEHFSYERRKEAIQKVIADL